MKIFLLLVHWIWRGDPFLQTRSEDRHPTLREAPKSDRLLSPEKGRRIPTIFR